MGLGLGISVDWASLVPYYARVASAFKARVEADGGTVESMSCLKADLKVLTGKLAPDLLLNDYDGAAAAYSLRLLDNTYSGNAIKVRRASDNAEQDIAFANNELDTATLETFASGTDAFVTTWYDQSGNGNDAAQGTASAQPKIVSSGSTILENGKPTIYYNGGQRLDAADNADLRNAQMTIFLVFNSDDSNRGDFIACGNALSYNSNNYIIGTHSLTEGSYYGRTPQTQYKPTITDTQNLFSFIADNSSTSLDMYVNAVSALSLTNNTIGTDNTEGFFIGASSASGGSLNSSAIGSTQEIILYSSNESSNRTGIETNINDFYSIY